MGIHMHSCGRILFISMSISLLHACVSKVSFNSCMCAWEGIKSRGVFNLFMVSACCWLGGYVLADVEIRVLSCIFFYFCGC